MTAAMCQASHEASCEVLDDHAPLLGLRAAGNGRRIKSEDRSEGTASLVSCVANLTNTIIGTGALAMPHAFASGGLVPGIVTVVFCGSASAFGLYSRAEPRRYIPILCANLSSSLFGQV
ncbi:hypothetical protein OIV83_004100 [Microbotryomycetes sp. JL201]|nr:hypothetical protein OIV83_004100 [Microbotryomycetes sp. JL201]